MKPISYTSTFTLQNQGGMVAALVLRIFCLPAYRRSCAAGPLHFVGL